MLDVAIVGAGPAGTAAATVLAGSGLQAAVYDKAVFPRDKFCGDGLTSGALRILDELEFDPATVASWKKVDDVFITSPSGRRAHFPLPRDMGQFAAVATRLDLDAALVDHARAVGADIHEGVGVRGVQLHDGHVELTLADDTKVAARFVLAADGMWSPTRKMLGLAMPGYRGDWHAFRQYWRNVGPRAASELHVWFEPDVLPGYVWSFPLADGRANIGFGVHRSTHRTGDMNRFWPAILERPQIREIIGTDAVPDDPHRAWPIPARVHEVALTAHRTLFIGDAAAACDPMTGEGIAQAMQTGLAAARAVIDAGTANPVSAAAAYEADVARNLAVDMRFAATLGRMLRTPLGARAAVRGASMTPWASRNFARWLFEDYPRAVLATPRRWQRDMFTRDGSFATR